MDEQNKNETATKDITEDVEQETEEVIEPEEQHGSDESEMEILKKEVEQLKQEKEESYQKVLRIQAEFDNYKKRMIRERETANKYKAQDIVNE